MIAYATLLHPDTPTAVLDEAWAEVCARHGWTWRPVGRQVRRDIVPTLAVWHWPGDTSTAESLGRKWARNEGASNVSSHCGIDETGVVWYAGPHMRTNHAAGHNTHTLGLDICVPVLVRDKANAERRGVYVGDRVWTSETMPNGGRHRHHILDLDPHVAAACGTLRRAVDEELAGLRWVDHMHVDPNRKPDCGPWRNDLAAHGAHDLFQTGETT